MPKIDAITGCSVMSEAEFWQSEGLRENRDANDIRDEFYDDMRKSFDEHEKEIEAQFKDLGYCLFVLQRADAECEENAIGIIEVLEVLESRCSASMRGASGSVRAKVRCDDGSEKIVRWGFSESAGSRMEPPDYYEEFRVDDN